MKRTEKFDAPPSPKRRRPSPYDIFWQNCQAKMLSLDVKFRFNNDNHEDECRTILIKSEFAEIGITLQNRLLYGIGPNMPHILQ